MSQGRLAPGAAVLAFALAVPGAAGAQAASSPPPPPALRLPSGAKPVRQSVALTIVPSQPDFSGVTEIELELEAATSFLWLNGRELQVKEASLSLGGAVTTAKAQAAGEDFLGFAFERPVGPGRATLRVAYAGAMSRKDTEGLFAQQEGGDWYVFTQFESTAARRAFPCFDEPSYKIPWKVTLKVPPELAALSNSPEGSSSLGRMA
jgi:alanyl aminopeptidase